MRILCAADGGADRPRCPPSAFCGSTRTLHPYTLAPAHLAAGHGAVHGLGRLHNVRLQDLGQRLVRLDLPREQALQLLQGGCRRPKSGRQPTDDQALLLPLLQLPSLRSTA
jgi:hypothetical protein